MDAATVATISVALSVDSMAVATAIGLTISGKKAYNAIKIGLFFGAFQSLMMLIGWAAGSSISAYISALDHWAAFALLSIVGLKMIYEGLKPDRDQKKDDGLSNRHITALSIATSIDSLAVGLSLSFVDGSILVPAIAVGTICFALSALALVASAQLSRYLADRIKAVGGMVLIAIGIRIVLEHVLGW
ncbi:MAG: manganese efflux pump MntP family protein [Candidatus Methanomethylicia archaeon]|nr:manganese efflux pump MntP family protein [Candidatus Methanomethylicia archaeon]